MYGRHVLNVKIPRDMLDEAQAIVRGTGTKAERKGTAAAALGFLLEMYLINYPDVMYMPSARNRTPEAAEVQVNIATGEELADLLSTYMGEERERLARVWRMAPRERRDGKRPPKPEYRGLVIAAIKEGTHTRCYGCK